MDEITKGWLQKLAKQHPQSALVVSHQFLAGFNKKEAGFVPNDWNGEIIEYISQPLMHKSEKQINEEKLK